MPGSTASPSSARPPRVMGLADVALFMVTAGCTLQWTALAAATGPSSLIVWACGGIGMFLPISVSVVFLSARYPDEGGLYAWSKRAFGPFAGFMTGWTYWSGTLAFLPSVLYFTAGSALLSSARSSADASSGYFITFSIVRSRNCEVAQQRRRGCALGRNAAADCAGAGELVALRPGNRLQSTYRYSDVPPRRRHLLDDTRLRLDRARGRLVHGCRNPRSTSNGAPRPRPCGPDDRCRVHRWNRLRPARDSTTACEWCVRRDRSDSRGRRQARSVVADSTRCRVHGPRSGR